VAIVCFEMCVNQCTLDLEIDRVERIDSTPLKIDRLRWKSIDSIDSLPSVYSPIYFSLRNFSWAVCFSSSCLFVCRNHGLCSWLLNNSQTCRLARSPDPYAKTTGRIELQIGVLIGLDQCHFVLDGCPVPYRLSVTFPGEGHSWSLNILLPYMWRLK